MDDASQKPLIMKDKSHDSIREVSSLEIFQSQRTVAIVHDGERYILRITRKNRLILQK
jgi:hemin uptake protein HemP